MYSAVVTYWKLTGSPAKGEGGNNQISHYNAEELPTRKNKYLTVYFYIVYKPHLISKVNDKLSVQSSLTASN